MPKRPLTELATFAVNAHRFRLEAGGSRLLRLTLASGREPDRADLPSYAVPDRDWQQVPFTVKKRTKGLLEIRTGEENDGLTIKLWQSPFAVRIEDRLGNVQWETVGQPDFDESGVLLSRVLPDDEIIHGYGELGETFDRRGMKFDLWNTDDVHRNARQNFYCQIPVGMHRRHGGHYSHFELCDNPGRIHYDLGFTDNRIVTTRTATGDLVLWLGFGLGLQSCVLAYSLLTGRMERPPLWALGVHQCRWSYATADRVREIAAEYRKRKIPCDAIYLDIDYMDAYRVFTWSDERFPDPKGLIDDLHADGFRVVAIVDPGVKVHPGDPAFEELSKVPEGFVQTAEGEVYQAKVWPGDCHFPDFTVAKTRAVWGRHQNRGLLDIGVDGIWNDMNEPAVFDVPGHTFPDDLVQYDHGRRSSHGEVHQIYGHQMARASHEGLIKARPKERPFVITRSGWAGVQRHAMVWTGDNDSTWASMALDLQLNLSMGLSGVPFVGCDIGGFRFDGSGELFARWMEWGVFQPFCRIHSASGTRDQEPWSFGPEVEAVARRMAEVRMSLLPYLAKLFVLASNGGWPVNRPLSWSYEKDRRCDRIADQFLLGDDIMVAPVLTPGADHRMVYFPAASSWRSFWDDTRWHGGDEGLYAVVHAPLGRPPVFTRAGSVIPMRRDKPLSTAVGRQEVTALRLTGWNREFPEVGVKIFPFFSEDDGATQKYRKSWTLLWCLLGEDAAAKFELSIWPTKGYVGSRAERASWCLELPLCGRRVLHATIGGKVFAGKLVTGDDILRLDFQTPAGSAGTTIIVQFDTGTEPAAPPPAKPARPRRPRSK